jgi:prophage regulatory protein
MTEQSVRLLRRKALRERIGLGDSQLDAHIAAGEFPAPIKLTDSGRAVAWIEAEVEEWLAKRIKVRAAAKAEKAEKAPKAAKKAPPKSKRGKRR